MSLDLNSMLLSSRNQATVVIPEPEPTPDPIYEQGSVRFRNSAGASAQRVISIPSSSYRKGVISIWCKRSATGTVNPQHIFQSAFNESPYSNYSIAFTPDDKLSVNFSYQFGPGTGWGDIFRITTNRLFRDTTAWLHIYFAWDTTLPVPSERGKLVINGKRVRNLFQSVYPPVNTLVQIDAVGNTNMIGDTPGKGVFTQGTSFDGYFSEYDRIDGWVPDVTEFGQFDSNGFWKAKPFVVESVSTVENTDPYFNNVALLLHGDGTAGSNAFVDSSNNHFTSAVTFGSAQHSSVQKKFGETSIRFDGSSSYISYEGFTPLLTRTTNFTVEGWIYLEESLHSDGGRIIGYGGWQRGNGWELSTYVSQNKINLNIGGGSSWTSVLDPAFTGIQHNRWHHIAMSRDGNIFRCFTDGVLTGTLNSAVDFGTINALRIFEGDNSTPKGYLDDLRITTGVARYVTNFTPPTLTFANLSPAVPEAIFDPYLDKTSLLLSGDTIADNSFNALTLTPFGNIKINTDQALYYKGCLEFDGTVSGITIDSTALFGFGAGDFTVEMMVNPASGTSLMQLLDFRTSMLPAPFTLALDYINGSYRLMTYTAAGDTGDLKVNTPIEANSWTHIALVRKNGVLNFYVGGKILPYSNGNPANAGNINFGNSCQLKIGIAADGATAPYRGLMQDIRITKGFARYDSNFDRPTAPLFDIRLAQNNVRDPYYSKVALLLESASADGVTTFIDKGPKQSVIQNVNSVATSTNQKRYNNSSIRFTAGAEQELLLEPNVSLYLNTDDFTIEFWFMLTSNNEFQRIISNTTGVFINDSFTVRMNATNQVFAFAGGDTGILSNTTIPIGQWTFCAITRRNGLLRLFINGQFQGSEYSANSTTLPITRIGGHYLLNGTKTEFFKGYLDSVRITKGVARYVSDFSVPAKTFTLVDSGYEIDPYYSKVALLLHMEGVNGSSTFVDSSKNTFVPAIIGNPTIVDNVSKFGYGSGLFNGSTDIVAVPTSANWNLKSKDFTLEAQVYPLSNQAMEVMACRYTNEPFWLLRRNTDGTLRFVFRSTTAYVTDVTTAQTVPLGVFTHIAVCRKNGIVSIFIGGVKATLSGTNTVGEYQDTNYPLYIGAGDPTSNHWNGYLDEVRVTLDLARYENNFIPPGARFQDTVNVATGAASSSLVDPYFKNVVFLTSAEIISGTPYLIDKSINVKTLNLVGQTSLVTSTLKDGSSSVFGYTGMQFLGSPGNPVGVAANSDNDFNLGDTYTIELWLKPFTLSSPFGIVNRGFYRTNGTWDDLTFSIRHMPGADNKGILRCYFYATTNANEQFIDVPAALIVSQWSNIAVVRKGTNGYVFIDGELRGSIGSLNTPNANTRPLVLGAWEYDVAPEYFFGFMDQVRITKGVARYTSNFTIPVANYPDKESIFGDNGFRLDFKNTSSLSNLFSNSTGTTSISFSESFDTLDNWTVSQISGGSGGNAGIANSQLVPTAFGSGAGWHGPKISRSIPPLGDFDITFNSVSFGNVSSDIGYINISVGNSFWFIMSDAWDNATAGLEGYAFGVNNDNGTQLYQTPNTSTEVLNSVSIRLTRTGNLFTGYLNGIVKISLTCPLTAVSSVSVSFAQYSTYSVPPMSVGGVAIYGATPKQWTINGVSLSTDVVLDTPQGFSSDIYGNYPTMDPWTQLNAIAPISLYDGNLRATVPQTSGNSLGYLTSTHPLQDGQYLEMTITNLSRDGFYGIWFGLTPLRDEPYRDFFGVSLLYPGAGTPTGVVYRENHVQTSISPDSFGNNTVVGFAFFNRSVWISINGNWLTSPPDIANTSSSNYTFNRDVTDKVFATIWGRDSGNTVLFNFGQLPFSNSPPAGFESKHVSNWALPAIAGPSLYFDTTTYAGDGLNRNIRLFNFDSDLTWVKSRSASGHHVLFTKIRGNDKGLIINSASREITNPNAHTFGVNGIDTLDNTLITISGTDAVLGKGCFGNLTLPPINDLTNCSHFPQQNGTYVLSRTLTAQNDIELYAYCDVSMSASADELYVRSETGSLKIVPRGTNGQWVRISLGVTTLTELTVERASWSGADFWISCILVDGVIVNNAISDSINTNNIQYSAWGWTKSTQAGIDVVTYDGAAPGTLVAHSLTTKPEVVIYKCLDDDGDWSVVTNLDGNMKVGYLNKSVALIATTIPAPTAQSLILGNEPEVNAIGKRFMAILMTSKRGYSKMGIYDGKSSTSAPAVYCGFKPRFLMVKQMSGSNSNWYMFDSLRDSDNPISNQLQPNLTNAESFGQAYDFTSTGFVVRSSSTDSFNGSGERYLFIAFADVPTQYALAS